MILRASPPFIRDPLLRQSLKIPSHIPSQFTFKVADTISELEGAFRLVYKCYQPLGYCPENSLSMRATLFHALPTTSTLIAKDGDLVVGTLTIVRHGRLGLPLDRVFGDKLQSNKAERLAEITSLSIDPAYRRKSGGTILFPLLKLMHEYATSYFGVNQLLVVIHPRERHFYKSLLLFEDIPNAKSKDYLGAPAIGLRLNLRNAPDLYKKTYAHKKETSNLYRFFVERNVSNIIFPKRNYHKISDPLVKLDYFRELFVEKLQLQMDPFLRRRIEDSITHTENLRRYPRIEVDSPALMSLSSQTQAQNIPCLIKDVSRQGFQVFFPKAIPLEEGRQYQFNVHISPHSTAAIQATPIWTSSQQFAGFKLTQSDLRWHEYVNFLYADRESKSA